MKDYSDKILKRMKMNLYLITFILLLTGCSSVNPPVTMVNNPGNVSLNTKEELPSYDSHTLGLIKSVDDIQQTLQLFDTEKKEVLTLNYTGGTDITDQYEQIISMSQIQNGEIVDAYYDNDTLKLEKLTISKSAWDYKNIDKFTIDKGKRVIKIADKKYQYTEDLEVFYDNKPIPLIDINEQDELEIKGINGQIHSIIVTKGHGYIRLKNYKDFIGGYLMLGYDIALPISENMLIVAREGNYELFMENGELKGNKTITVTPNKELKVDMGEFKIEAERVGKINFIISPEGADLSINETLTKYDDPISLNYGDHNIKVTLEGYEEFTGVLTVVDAYQNFGINLAAKATEAAENKNAVTIENEPANSNYNPPNTATNQPANSNYVSPNTVTNQPTSETIPLPTIIPSAIDEEHTISIQSPQGAEVYLNGTYKGTVPVNFTKSIGNLTFTFCKDGYVNKSYNMDITDDKNNVILTFPELPKSNG